MIFPRFIACSQCIAKQVEVVIDFDTALAHDLDELVMFPLGTLHPQDIVKKQFIMIAGGQAFHAEFRAVNDHLAELANF